VRLSSRELSYVLWALESVLPLSEPEEEEILLCLIDRIAAQNPFSPLCSSEQWRRSLLSFL
jgi:hypothetical protein